MLHTHARTDKYGHGVAESAVQRGPVTKRKKTEAFVHYVMLLWLSLATVGLGLHIFMPEILTE